MNKITALKIFTDFSMLMCFLLLFAYPATGGFAHEVLGVVLFVLFALHNVLNYRCYKALFKGGYGAERILRTSVNAALKNLPRLAGFCLRGAFFCLALYGIKVFFAEEIFAILAFYYTFSFNGAECGLNCFCLTYFSLICFYASLGYAALFLMGKTARKKLKYAPFCT